MSSARTPFKTCTVELDQVCVPLTYPHFHPYLKLAAPSAVHEYRNSRIDLLVYYGKKTLPFHFKWYRFPGQLTMGTAMAYALFRFGMHPGFHADIRPVDQPLRSKQSFHTNIHYPQLKN